MFCSACGQSIMETAVICPSCGSPTAKFETVRTQTTDLEISSSFLTVAYIAAVIIPIVGIVMGIIAGTKRVWGHMILLLLISLLMAGFWMSLFNQGY